MTCLWCGAPLATTNRRARYCSAAHRSMAHRHGPRAVSIGDRQPSKGGGELTVLTGRQLVALGYDEGDILARAL